MAEAAIISVRDLSKAYRIWRNPSLRLTFPLWQAVSRLAPKSSGVKKKVGDYAHSAFRDFFALNGVSFEIPKGESIGIIGRNGSGKSTLLQIIAGTLQPTSGSVDVRGRVAALLELGSGFNPEFTGRENVYLNGAVLGLSRREMDEKFDGIAAFADIGDFIDQPIKIYSSGMLVRLAFAVQTAVDPDILIVDEALSVGDIFFQQKCAARMRKLRDDGTTLLFVSHDLGSVRDLCERTLYLRHGRTAFWGESQQAIAHYHNESESGPMTPLPAAVPAPALSPAAPAETIRHFRSVAQWWTTGERTRSDLRVELQGVAFLDDHGHPLTKIRLGGQVTCRILFQARQEGHYHVAVELKNRYDQIINSTSSQMRGLEARPMRAGEFCAISFTFTFNLEAGRYTFQVVVAEHNQRPNRGQRLDTTPWLGPLEVEWNYEQEWAPFLGMFGIPVQVQYLDLNP